MSQLQSISRLWLLGCGNMGGALLEGWRKGGLADAAITVIDPALPQLGGAIRVVSSLPDEPLPDIFVSAIKPQVAAHILAPLSAQMTPHCLLLSIMAGIDCATLARMSGATAIVRAMPNTPARIGKGVSGLIAQGATDTQKAQAEALMASVGMALWLETEAQFDALTALSGSGPAYLFHFIEALAAAGVQQGLSTELAAELARQTVFGAAALAETSGRDAGDLRREVTSPNGTTAAGLAQLDGPQHHLTALLTQTLEAAAARSRVMAEEARAQAG